MKVLITLLIFNHALFLGGASIFKCPDNYYLNGCSCDPTAMSLTCDMTKDVPNFEDLYGFNFSEITIRTTHIKRLPLSNVNTKKLILVENHQLEDFDTLLSFRPNSLVLINNSGFTWTKFNDFLLQQSSNDLLELRIEEIPDNLKSDGYLQNSFNNFLNLRNISLRNNHIRRIKPRVFENLEYLQSLDLSFNSIDTLEKDSLNFVRLWNHLSIDLRKNQINLANLLNSSIGLNTNIRAIDLRENQINDLPEKPFDTFCSDRADVNLGGNTLNCNYYVIHWLLKMKNCKRYLKNAVCSRYNKNIFDMTDSQFKDRTTLPPTYKTTHPSIFSTKAKNSTKAY